ncbi:MAG: hypothetical protein DLM58_01340, partial [Pseudonocardiales bacterium]
MPALPARFDAPGFQELQVSDQNLRRPSTRICCRSERCHQAPLHIDDVAGVQMVDDQVGELALALIPGQAAPALGSSMRGGGGGRRDA